LLVSAHFSCVVFLSEDDDGSDGTADNDRADSDEHAHDFRPAFLLRLPTKATPTSAPTDTPMSASHSTTLLSSPVFGGLNGVGGAVGVVGIFLLLISIDTVSPFSLMLALNALSIFW
jgi:hypothetical protein